MKHCRLALIALATSSGVPAAAAPPPAPGGTYHRSCSNIQFNYPSLSATCDMESGGKRTTKIADTRLCEVDVFNRDGGLQCYAGPARWGEGRVVPQGSYMESCKDVDVRDYGKFMVAQCKDERGNYQGARLALVGCQLGGRIDNDNGRLVCH